MDTLRINATKKDLAGLNASLYCDLGPGQGHLSIKLREENKNVIAVEAPWAIHENRKWPEENNVKMYFIEFFTGDFNKIAENVDCFILAHCIAHFRYSPYLLFQKIYDKLPVGGRFYLSTVNGTSFDRVLSFMKGEPIVEKVSKDLDPGFIPVAADFNKTGQRQIWDDWMHVKEYTKTEIEELFRKTGFKIEKSYYRTNFKHWKKNILIKLFPHLAEEIVVIGIKEK